MKHRCSTIPADTCWPKSLSKKSGAPRSPHAPALTSAYSALITDPAGVDATSRKPVLLTVDDDPAVSRAVARDLRRQPHRPGRIGPRRARHPQAAQAVGFHPRRSCIDDSLEAWKSGSAAGRAAMHLSRRPKSVTILMRGPSLEASMSHYLNSSYWAPISATSTGCRRSSTWRCRKTATPPKNVRGRKEHLYVVPKSMPCNVFRDGDATCGRDDGRQKHCVKHVLGAAITSRAGSESVQAVLPRPSQPRPGIAEAER